MANEITSSTIDDFSYAAMIWPTLLATLSENPGVLGFAREIDLVGKPTGAVKIGSIGSYWGSPGDRGASVDTEFNATEAVEIANTPVSSGSVTVSTGEYGVAHELSDIVAEDSVDTLDLLNLLKGPMMLALKLAIADDLIALFANLSTSIGSSGNDLTIAQLLAGKNTIRAAGGYSQDGLVYVLDNQAFLDVENAFVGTGTSMAIYALAADRILDWQPAANAGMNGDGRVAGFRGDPVIVSGLTDTANAGADVISAAFVKSSRANDDAGLTTYGLAWKRYPRFETERHAKKRTTDLVMTMRVGAGELLDGTGVKFVTDAP